MSGDVSSDERGKSVPVNMRAVKEIPENGLELSCEPVACARKVSMVCK